MDLPVPTDRERVIGLTVPVPEPWASQVRSARAAAGDPLAHTAPHVTILPPTLVPADGLPAVTSFLRTTLTGVPAFTVHLAGVESFEPVSPVVYLALTQGARECTDLQARVRSADGSPTTRTSPSPTCLTTGPRTGPPGWGGGSRRCSSSSTSTSTSSGPTARPPTCAPCPWACVMRGEVDGGPGRRRGRGGRCSRGAGSGWWAQGC